VPRTSVKDQGPNFLAASAAAADDDKITVPSYLLFITGA